MNPGPTPKPTMHGPGWALAWLVHPVSVVALLVMILNDHVLKAAFGTWWTGKLSDVAGLVFFPALVALVVATTARLARQEVATAALRAIAITVTAVGFTWVKASDAGAATASAVLSALAGPSTVLRDPTDLLALPALALAYFVARHTQPHLRTAFRRAAVTVVLPVAVLASVATGPDAPMGAYDAGTIEGNAWIKVGGNGYPATWMLLTGTPGLTAGNLSLAGQERLEIPAHGDGPVCLPANPDTCFRPTPERWGVDISHDGGVTWEPDLAINYIQWERITRDNSFSGELPGVKPQTRAVTVARWRGADVVVAANDLDGIAIRNADGVWQRYRYPWPGSNFQPADLPSPFIAEPALALQFTILMGLASSAAAVAATGVARRWRLERWQWWVGCVSSTVFIAVGGWCAYQLTRFLDIHPSADYQGTALPLSVGLVGLLLGPVLSVPLLMSWHAKDRARHILVVPALIGFGAVSGVVVTTMLCDVTGLDGLALWTWEWRVPLALALTVVASAVVVWRRWMPTFERPADGDAADTDTADSPALPAPGAS